MLTRRTFIAAVASISFIGRIATASAVAPSRLPTIIRVKTTLSSADDVLVTHSHVGRLWQHRGEMLLLVNVEAVKHKGVFRAVFTFRRHLDQEQKMPAMDKKMMLLVYGLGKNWPVVLGTTPVIMRPRESSLAWLYPNNANLNSPESTS